MKISQSTKDHPSHITHHSSHLCMCYSQEYHNGSLEQFTTTQCLKVKKTIGIWNSTKQMPRFIWTFFKQNILMWNNKSKKVNETQYIVIGPSMSCQNYSNQLYHDEIWYFQKSYVVVSIPLHLHIYNRVPASSSDLVQIHNFNDIMWKPRGAVFINTQAFERYSDKHRICWLKSQTPWLVTYFIRKMAQD